MSYEHKVLREQYLCTHWPKHVITPLVRGSINSTTYNFTEAKVPIRINIPDAQYLNTHIHTLMQFNAWNLPHVFTLCVCFLCPCDKMWFGRHSSGFENFARCSYCNVRLRTDFVRSTESQLYEVQSWHFTGKEWVRRWAWCNAIAMDYALLIHLQGCKRHKPGTSRGRGKVKYKFLRICLITESESTVGYMKGHYIPKNTAVSLPLLHTSYFTIKFQVVIFVLPLFHLLYLTHMLTVTASSQKTSTTSC